MNSSIGVHEIDGSDKGAKPPASPFFSIEYASPINRAGGIIKRDVT